MPFQRTKLDYAMSIFLLIAFIWAFFYGSQWGDLHGKTNIDPSMISYPNLWVILGPLVLVAEMFHLFVLPGKRRGRELPWRLYYQIAKEKIRDTLKEQLSEYHYWRNGKH